MTEDICRHEPKCECTEWMYVTVPNFRILRNACNWLREERKYTLISTEGVYDGLYHTGEYRFKFLCEQEYMWFKLRWS